MKKLLLALSLFIVVIAGERCVYAGIPVSPPQPIALSDLASPGACAKWMNAMADHLLQMKSGVMNDAYNEMFFRSTASARSSGGSSQTVRNNSCVNRLLTQSTICALARNEINITTKLQTITLEAYEKSLRHEAITQRFNGFSLEGPCDTCNAQGHIRSPRETPLSGLMVISAPLP